MSRISERFRMLRGRGRKALVPFITAGDPHPAVTVPLMHCMVESGADMIELGVPFSDPMADGPVIQRASERALEHQVSLRDVFNMVREFRRNDEHTPVLLMGYLNPVEVMGYEVFATTAAQAGVDGLLTVDMPPEEAGELLEALEEQAIDPIFLLAPTSTDERIARICRAARGFIYYVSLKGVTGSNALDVDGVERKLRHIREIATIPVGVGFGIKDAATAASVSRVADAVILGSVLVSRIEALAGNPQAINDELSGLIREIRAAMDAA